LIGKKLLQTIEEEAENKGIVSHGRSIAEGPMFGCKE